jgi:hypothetical protein
MIIRRNTANPEARALGVPAVRVVISMAIGNLIANRWKTAVIGGMGACATVLLVLGLSLLRDIDGCVQSSITASLSGHIQIYSSNSRDELALLGSVEGGLPRLEPVSDFAKVRSTL